MRLLLILLALLTSTSLGAQSSLNLFVWAGEIPMSLIHKFEKETGIKVNYATYESNEAMLAKLQSSKQGIYDVVNPSGYFVARMRAHNLLAKLDKSKLSHLNNLDPFLLNHGFDPANQYSLPMIWGATGIFVNSQLVKEKINSWSDLWQNHWKNQLLLLDDTREVFSASLLSLGLSPNSQSFGDIKRAYEQLLKLLPNVKLFSSDLVKSIMIDGDAPLGMAWNGDVYKASLENKNLRFIYPRDGFIIWIDNLAIPKNAPHKNNAYLFIDFILRAENASQIALIEGHSIANLGGKKLLPKALRENQTIYPDKETLKRGVFQQDPGTKASNRYNYYWRLLKLSS